MKKNHPNQRMAAADRRRSMRYVYAVSIFTIIGVTGIAPGIMSLTALKLGADEFYLGLLSLATLLPMAFSFFTLTTVERRGKRHVLFFWNCVSTFFTIGFVMIPMLTNTFSPDVLLIMILVVMVLSRSTGAMAGSGWFPILQDIVPYRVTGKFFANMRTAWQTAALVTLLGAAWFLGHESPWWKFELIFVIALLAFILRTISFLPMSEIPPQTNKTERSTMGSLLAGFFKKKTNRPLIAYLVTYAFAFGLCEPFKIKLLKDLGFSEGFILLALAMINLGAIVSLRFWGKIADRYGNRAIFGITHIAMIATTVLWICVDHSLIGATAAIGLYLFGSAFNSGNGIAQTRYIYYATDSTKQSEVTIANMIVFVTWGLAPLLGVLVLRLTESVQFQIASMPFDHYDLLFVLNALLFLIPHRLRRNLGLIKDTPTSEVVVFVLRPLINLFGPFAQLGNGRRPKP